MSLPIEPRPCTRPKSYGSPSTRPWDEDVADVALCDKSRPLFRISRMAPSLCAHRSCRSARCARWSGRGRNAPVNGPSRSPVRPRTSASETAIDVFMNPDRVVIGVRDDWARAKIQSALGPITARLEWMTVESAEVTKHAINAFLATSVAFMNELAALCERVGADATEVERGLKTEGRIGPRAYLSPGGAFAGGTLARDVSFLRALGTSLHRPTPLMDGVMAGNTAHTMWAERRLGSSLIASPARQLPSGVSPTSPVRTRFDGRQPSTSPGGS